MKLKRRIFDILLISLAAIFLIGIFYSAGLTIMGIYLGDINEAEKIVSKYPLFQKIVISLLTPILFFIPVGISIFIYKIFKGSD